MVERRPSRWPWAIAAIAIVGAGSTVLGAEDGDEPAAPEPPPDLPSDLTSAGDAQWVTPVEDLAPAAPAVVGPVVVVAADDGALHGIERDTGARLWRTEPLGPRVVPPVAIGQHVVAGAGASVRAFRAVNGAEAWRLDLAADLAGAPTVIGPRLVVVTDEGEAVSIDGQRGEVRWRAVTGVAAAGPPASDGRIVAVPGADGRVRALRVESGAVAYTAGLGDVVGLAVSQGLVYAATGGGDLVGLGDDGAERWRVPVAGGPTTAPVTVAGAVVVAGGDGAVRAHDRLDGDPLWSRTAADPVTAPLLHRRDVVLVTTADGWLHRLDAGDGRRAGSARAGRGAVAALNPGAGPAVFAVDASGAVTGLRLGS